MNFFDSAFKHKLSKEQILQSLADPCRIYDELQDDEDGNPQDLVIGKTHAEVILEIDSSTQRLRNTCSTQTRLMRSIKTHTTQENGEML